MHESTTVRVARRTRDGLRRLADNDGVTLDEELLRLVLAERQRRIGRSLAALDLDTEDRAWIDAGIATAGDDASR